MLGEQRVVAMIACMTELSRAFAFCAASDEATEIRGDVSFFHALKAALNKQSSNNRNTPEKNRRWQAELLAAAWVG